jgi:predicted NAD/FAD-binding protein
VVKVAVIGTGVSGLGAAYVLAKAHDVTLFEREARAGGHTYTVSHAGLNLDCGFLVHNQGTYPKLMRLFRELGVATQESEMSFSVDCASCGLVYSSTHLFADRSNLRRPRFLRLVAEIARWLRTAGPSLDRGDHDHETLAEYAEHQGYSHQFVHHFLVPITSALWSTSPERTLDFPAGYAIRFFEHHGMLGLRRIPWRTVVGGSSTYVERLQDRFGDHLRLADGVRSLRRTDDGVELRASTDEVHRFDAAVVATHADQALDLLEDATLQEKSLLGAFAYTDNETVLHTDERFLPRLTAARASWNYTETTRTRPTVTYYLNRLQRVDGDTPYLVTLNRTDDIDPAKVLRKIDFSHPRYTVESLAAQRSLGSLSGPRHTAFAGAYHGNGFHEDGLASGVRAAAALGVTW